MIPSASSTQKKRLRVGSKNTTSAKSNTATPTNTTSTANSLNQSSSGVVGTPSKPIQTRTDESKSKNKRARVLSPLSGFQSGSIWNLESSSSRIYPGSEGSETMIGGGKSSRRHQRGGGQSNGFQQTPASTMDGRQSHKGAPKRLNVRVAKPAPKLEEGFEENAWNKLKETLDNIFTERSVSYSRQELSQEIEDLCIHRKGNDLFDKLSDVCKQHVNDHLLSKLDTNTTDDVTILSQMRSIWDKHRRELIAIRAIFIYLDRSYVVTESSTKSIWAMGLQFFREALLGSKDALKKTVDSFLNIIRREREGQVIDRAVLRDISKMFSELQMYMKELEEPLIRESENFFQTEAQRRVEQIQKEEYPYTQVADFLELVESRIHQELDRVRSCLEHKTQLKLVEIIERLMVQSNINVIVEQGFVGLMNNDKLQDISRMHYLFDKVGENAIKKLKDAWSENIRKRVGDIIHEDNDNKESSKTNAIRSGRNALPKKTCLGTLKIILLLATGLLGVFSIIVFHVIQCRHGMKTAFETVINGKANRAAELLAKFVDSKLRSGNKQETEEEVERILDRVVVIFRYIHGKDIFEAFYKKDLAKRLLLRRSASTELEKSFLQKLKTECGAAFTAKLEGMFKDMDHSEDLMNQWAANRSLKERGGVQADVHVLTSSHWPSYPAMDSIILPPLLKGCTDSFEDFYFSKFGSNRKLFWQHSLEHVTLKAYFPHGRKELEVSLFQALVLLLYNNKSAMKEKDRLDFSTIKDNTGVEATELKRTLQSLACGKVRILQKHPKGKEINDGDIFEFNRDFKAKLMRLKINTIQVKETKEEQKETNERVFRERSHLIDAAIVRIMKSRQQLTHRELVSETMDALSNIFSADSASIKKRIESLIERDYMERDENDNSTYHYVA